MKKIVALLLCAAALISVFAGCRDKNEIPPSGGISAGSSPAANEQVSETPPASDPAADSPKAGTDVVDYNAAFAAFAPDAVMMNVGSYSVTWEELFFFIHKGIVGYDVTSWSDSSPNGEPWPEAILKYATTEIQKYKAIMHGTSIAGIALTDEEMASLEQDFEQEAVTYGGVEEYLKLFWEYDAIRSKSLYFYLVSTGRLYSKYLDFQYGENASKITDSAVSEYASKNGYLMAKHILRKSDDESADAAALELIEHVKDLLDSYKGNDLGGYFDELMRGFTEDSLDMFPDGYLFQPKDMVEPFSNACLALEIGEYSDIVKSQFGYHIIYRLPIDLDAVPIANANSGITLRASVAIDLFSATLKAWVESLPIKTTPEMDSMDMTEVFKIK